jgi:hypothetical protein
MSYGLTVGSGVNGEPKGFVKYASEFTAGPAAATNGSRFSTDEAQALRMKLAAANELRDTNTYGYLMRPEVLFGLLRERIAQYSGQARANGQPVLANLFLDETTLRNALRASFGHTTQLSAAETAGSSSSCSTAYYGDWSLFAFADFREPRFNVSTVAGDGSTGSAFLDDQVYMVLFMEHDCAVLRGSAFTSKTGCETNDANWTA